MTAVRCLSVCAVLLCCSGAAFGQTREEPKPPDYKLSLEIRLIGLDFVNPVREIGNIPVSLRQIPSHPDDGWIYGSQQDTLTIPGDTAKVGMFFQYSPAVMAELQLKRLRLRGGVSMALSGGTPADRHQVNQFGGTGRGTGTSLVFYDLKPGQTFAPGFIYEADVQAWERMYLIAGTSREKYRVNIVTGYDRYNADEKYASQTLASGTMNKLYAGFGYRSCEDLGVCLSGGFVGGRAQSTLAEEWQGLTLKSGQPWFIRMYISMNVPLWEK